MYVTLTKTHFALLPYRFDIALEHWNSFMLLLFDAIHLSFFQLWRWLLSDRYYVIFHVSQFLVGALSCSAMKKSLESFCYAFFLCHTMISPSSTLSICIPSLYICTA